MNHNGGLSLTPPVQITLNIENIDEKSKDASSPWLEKWLKNSYVLNWWRYPIRLKKINGMKSVLIFLKMNSSKAYSLKKIPERKKNNGIRMG